MLVKRPDARALLNALVSRHFQGRTISLLEAGGGSRTKLDLSLLQVAEITTIDISPEQLEANDYADVKILGDLQEYAADRTYDLVVIYNVLEHIPRADLAMANLVGACADEGLLVVGSPYKRSFSGMTAWLTPHWFHVFFYRYALGQKEAGQPGHAPFPTHFHPMTSPDTLVPFLQERGFDCEFLAFYEGAVYATTIKRRPLVGLPLMFVTMALNALTPKRYNARHGDYYAVFRKRSGEGGQLRA